MLRSANRFIGYSFEFVNLRILRRISNNPARRVVAVRPPLLAVRSPDDLKRNMAQILLMIVCADDLKHLFREILLKLGQKNRSNSTELLRPNLRKNAINQYELYLYQY